jgi:hypothetical protein
MKMNSNNFAESKVMNRHSSFFGALSTSVLLLCGGCHRADPQPVEPTPSVASKNALPAAEPSHDESPFELEPRFELLTRDDFEAFAAEPETWVATADGIACTGKPRGYLYSKHPYENFTWRLDYRFPRPENLKDDGKFKGNTGFLIYISGEQKLWPVCLEVQGKYIQMAAIKENGGAEPVTVEDNEAVRNQSRKPVGRWNSLEIISKDGSISVSLNGAPISSSKVGTLNNGLIGIQAEDHPFEVRRMRIRID